jgi:hypothetical protein
VNYCTHPARYWRLWLLTVFLSHAVVTHAQIWISEVLFNPPGADAPNEYVELRGTPNLLLGPGTYWIAVDGDADNNPGTIQNVFDLSGRRIGGNGFLVLLPNSNIYAASLNATLLKNNNGPGFGTSSGSSINHRGRNGQTELENASVTYFLVQSTNNPSLGTDIDSDDDGALNGADYASWNVLDAVALLDNDGAGDIGYGKINFRRDALPGSGATVLSGTIVPVSFTPQYVGRTGHTINWAAASWVVSDGLSGNAPNWSLDGSDTVPAGFSGLPLNHIGLPNFGAANLPGVVIFETSGSTDLLEGSGTDSFSIALNTAPVGSVTVQVTAPASVQISTNSGATFGTSYALTFNSTSPRAIMVRVLDDNFVGRWARDAAVSNAITASADPNYPVGALVPPVKLNVTENEWLLLNELKVNPPGAEDAPYEFVELLGSPNVFLTNVFFLVLEGNTESNPGVIRTAIDLTGAQLGFGGLLAIVGDGHPYSIPGGSRVFLAPQLSVPGGALGNDSVSFLLVSSPGPLVEGYDLDAGDNGVAENLPVGTTVLDSLGWLDGGDGDELYTPVALTQSSGIPDAAARWPGNTNANSLMAWFNADLLGPNADTLAFEGQGGSTNFPYGTPLSPGALNKLAPLISPLVPFSSVIGDPTAPTVSFTISDPDTPVNQLVVSAASDNQSVVPNSNLILSGTGATRTLNIVPTNNGYATITITVVGTFLTGHAPFRYAASWDLRGGGRFHTGVSDASTAMPIDANYMFVGDDENQILRIFSRSNSGAALVEFNMNPFLDLRDLYEDGRPREVDIEGTTRVGNRVFWLGSHSHSRDAELVTNRARVFGTDIAFAGTNSTVNYVGRYDYLKLDLLNWDTTNGHGKGSNYYGLAASSATGVDPKTPDGSGFNFEGLTMAPGSTDVAYLAFRAPLVPPTNRVHALIIPVTNFTTLAICNSPVAGVARFGTPIELNLGGRAIRSIEGGPNGFMLVAGPPGFATGLPPSDFRLFTWNGFANVAPQERAASLTNLLPEAIVELPPGPWTSSSRVQLISDNGIALYYADGIEAKFLPVPQFKKFRSDWVTLGPVVTPQPVFRSVQCSGSSCVLTWYSVAGQTYRVQFKSALTNVAWSNVAGDVTATAALASKTVSVSGATQVFYRVVIP